MVHQNAETLNIDGLRSFVPVNQDPPADYTYPLTADLDTSPHADIALHVNGDLAHEDDSEHSSATEPYEEGSGNNR